MLVAYLILAHNKPSQLIRLIEELCPAPVFVHFDARASKSDWHEISTYALTNKNVQLTQRERCYWGSFGIVAGTLHLIQALLNSKARFDYAILLSGADYPVLSGAELRAWLVRTPGKEHIESFALDEPNRWDNDSGQYAARNRYRRFHLRFRSRVVSLWRRGKAPGVRELFGGSQWWCLTEQCLKYVSAFVAGNPHYLSYFSSSLIPDEAFFQTIISNSKFRGSVSGKDTSFAVWDRPNPPFPAVLTREDFCAIVASGKPFARKFDDTVDAEVLDMLDEHRKGAPPSAKA